MSCPDWQALCERPAAGRADDDAWDQALWHLDGCPRCQQVAPVREPALLLRRLPALEVGVDEIASMKRSVADLRRGLEALPQRPSRTVRQWQQAALAASVLLAAVALTQLGLSELGTPGPGLPEVAPAQVAEAPLPAADGNALRRLDLTVPGRATAAERALRPEQMPLVDYVDPATGSVVEVVDNDISLVLVLPPSDV